jgi:diketogulonate reductase-like aldo/keto reductase
MKSAVDAQRRALLRTGSTLATMALLPPTLPAAAADLRLDRAIPRTGERLPVIGMGTWLTFDVGETALERQRRRAVMQSFFEAGGGMIDSSPMYGRAERVVGDLLRQVTHANRLFSASKVWTPSERVGRVQLVESESLWGRRLDLQQIHNMLSWPAHLRTLREWKESGRIRYIGITTSHGRRHDEMESALRREHFDFVQLTYNLADRSVERRLLPLAAERGIAVIVNRPFDGGLLFNALGNRPLPAWAAEFDCANWAQFMLKWIVAHPAVTCAIPATTDPDHMRENMGAGTGRLPDATLRRRMTEAVDRLL